MLGNTAKPRKSAEASTAKSNTATRPASALRWGWRLLALLWATTLLGAAATAVLISVQPAQDAKPQIAQVAAQPAAHPALHEAAHDPAREAPTPAPAPPPTPLPPLPTGAEPHPGDPIPPPQSALLEPSSLVPAGMLPRIAADGRQPFQVYAAGSPRPDGTPRVALLLAGIGMNEAQSMAAITVLPAAISLALSPYAPRTDALLARARDTGHEVFLSLPMEPQGYPLNDPGDRALLTGASQQTNAQRLEWALTRFSGYVGGTGALGGEQGGLRGERFGAALDQMLPLLETLGRRGLLYVDPRPNAAWTATSLPAPTKGSQPLARSRGIDLVVDEQAGDTAIDAALVRLEVIARKRGSAIGLLGLPAPVAMERVGVWALGLPARGVSLAPVSAVVQMPVMPLTTARSDAPPPARGQP